jgi:hypothetical protein
MFSSLPCSGCEKIAIEFERQQPILNLLDAPNTFDRSDRALVWRQYDLTKYALVPRLAQHNRVWVDLYFCGDEDDLDDLDLVDYSRQFLANEVLPKWKDFSVTHLAPAVVAVSDGWCWRLPETKHLEQQ